MNTLCLAEINGQGMIHSLMVVLIVGVCALILWWLGKWACAAFSAPGIVLRVWTGLFIFLGAFCLINFLLSLVGYPLIKW